MAEAHIPTPTVGPWKISLTSTNELLDLTLSSDDNGNLSGTLAGSQLMGFWDADAMRAVFLRIQDPTDPTSIQVFTGYLSSSVQGIDQLAYTLAGTYQAFAGANG
jgi:hypothetical protein